MNKISDKILVLLLFICGFIVLLGSYLILHEKLPLGFSEWSWYYHNYEGRSFKLILYYLVILTLLLLWFKMYLLSKTEKSKLITILTGSLIIMLLITFAEYKIHWMNFVVNDFGTIGYLSFAKRFHSFWEILSNYNSEIMKPENFRTHPSTHPFGSTALYYLFWKFDNIFFKNPNYDPLVGYLPMIIGWLGIIPLYKMTKSFLVIVLLVLTPTIYFFAPFPELVIMTLILFGLYLIINKRDNLSYLIIGLLFSIATTLSLSSLPLIGACILWMFFFGKDLMLKEKIVKIAIISSVMIIFYLSLNYIWHYNLLENIKISKPSHMDLVYGERSYSKWLYWNLYDYFICFLGIPSLTLIVYGIIDFIRHKKTLIKNRNIQIGLLFLIMLLLTNFTGTVRGEMARLYLSFTPFLLLLIPIHKKFPKWFIISILIIGSFQVVAMQTKIHTVPRITFPDDVKIID